MWWEGWCGLCARGDGIRWWDAGDEARLLSHWSEGWDSRMEVARAVVGAKARAVVAHPMALAVFAFRILARRC